MSAESVFMNDLQVKLIGLLDEEKLKAVMLEIGAAIRDYDITERKTEVAVQEGLPQCMKVFLVGKKIEGRSKATLDLYRIALEDLFRTVTKPVDEISTNDMRIYLYELKERRGIQDVTMESRRRIIHSFFTWCHNEGYIPRNPMRSISPIKYEVKPRLPFSDTQMEIIRGACRTDRERAIIETLYATGCRITELVGLKVADIDFRSREVKLFGKGKKHRLSYLNARAEVAIEAYLKGRKGESEYLFLHTRKPYAPLKKAGAERIVKLIGQRAAIKNVIPHRIRHTTATDALDHGMPVDEVQKLLGHEDLETTMIYAKVRQSNVANDHKKYIV